MKSLASRRKRSGKPEQEARRLEQEEALREKFQAIADGLRGSAGVRNPPQIDDEVFERMVAGDYEHGQSPPEPEGASADGDSADEDEPLPPGMIKSCRLVLCAMAEFHPQVMASIPEIADKIDLKARPSNRTVRKAVQWLCKHHYAERETTRSGARLTTRGRMLRPKIAD